VAIVTRPGPPEEPLAELASELRHMRNRAHLTYRELAAKTGRALSTLTAAAAGKRLPSWSVARAWAQACGGAGDVVLGLYQRACAASGRAAPARDLAGIVSPDPAVATTAAEFITQMIRLRAWAGISLRTLNLRSGGRLPPSTVSEVLRRDRLPRREFLLDYVRACGVCDDAIGEWEHAWNVIRLR
jgi:transcriptional regulator with XRE-family HTH domain